MGKQLMPQYILGVSTWNGHCSFHTGGYRKGGFALGQNSA